MDQPLSSRRELQRERVLAEPDEPIRKSPVLEASLSDSIHSVKAQGLEGTAATRSGFTSALASRCSNASTAWRRLSAPS